MKKHTMPDMKEGNVNVTPLIDVVMCLIIFFMLAAKIGVTTGDDAAIKEIPESISGTELKNLGNAITVNLRKEGRMSTKGQQPWLSIKVGEELRELWLIHPETGQREFGKVLELKRKEFGDQFHVIIRGEKDVPYQYLEPLLMECANAAVRNVDFKTKMVTKTTTGG